MKLSVIILILLVVTAVISEAKKGGKGRRKDKRDKKDCKGKKCKDRTGQGRIGSIEYVPPYSGMKVRLGGLEKNSTSGNVEVFLRNQWGMICDDEWDSSDANVICRQLGFSRGAVVETGESFFGENFWNSTNILMDDVNCAGNELAIQRCQYVYPSNCVPSEGAGVVCQPHSGCPDRWVAGPDGCYLLSDITTTRREFAVNKCKTLGGHLANIESEAENHFLSMVFSDFYGEGILTGGIKKVNGWMWEKVTMSDGSDFDFGDLSDIFRIRRSPRQRRPGRSPRRRRPGSRRPQGGRSGGSRTSGRSTAVESTVRSSIQYFKWFPGWVPGNRYAEPTSLKNDKCIYLKNTFKHPDNVELSRVEYLYWDDEICKRTRKKFKQGFHYLCEMPRQQVAMPTTESAYIQEEGCYVDNGVSYRGTVSRTDKGTPCIPWALSGMHTPEKFPDSGLEGHNYCRNPDSDVRPWCYVDYEGTFNFCPIPQCSETTEPGSVTTPAVKTTTTAELDFECPGDEFYCRNSSKCISQQWRCDVESDCDGGEDEVGCAYSIEQFRKIPGRMLQNHVTKETYVGSSNETCAKLCLSRTQYVCRSFSFKQETRNCILSDTNIQMSGLPALGEGYNYYEFISQTLDCEGMFTCGNGRCIETSKVCDGDDDCGDLTDERDCQAEAQPISIRLAEGGEHSGRVEIKYLGEWGVICDDNWDTKDAAVVCKMLGITSGIPKSFSRSKFGSGNANFLLDEVDCNGTETSLEECRHPGWKVHNCRSFEVAGVECGADKHCDANQYTCPDGSCIPARAVCDGGCDCRPNCEDENGSGEYNCQSSTLELVNGSQPNSGRVELIRNGLRGTVCDDGWDDKDATVVCRMLGFSYGKAAVGAQFGEGSGVIWLDGVECDGSEVSLPNCGHASWGVHDCTHSEDAGVFCSNTPPSGDELRIELVDGENAKEGRVEVIRNGVRGTVCDDEWTNEDAKVVCRMLGHSGGVAKAGGSYGPGSDTIEILLDDVKCLGSEQSLKDCTHAGWGTHNCAHGEDAGVACGISDTDVDTAGEDNEIPGFGACGRRPMEENSDRVKRDEPFEEREIEDVPKFERIVGGFTATKGFYPWQAGIRRLVRYPDIYSHHCGGTIISEFWILTAAHCYADVLKDFIRVRAGDHDNKIDDEYEEEFEVEELISHAEYDEDTFDNDIALIKIKPKDGHGIRFSDHVQPACLPDAGAMYETGKKCHVSGWGKTELGYQNMLKSARVPLLADRTCDSLYKDITRNMFCAGYLEGGIDTCSGDSGGPLVCELDGVYTVLGATSFGAGCAEANAPGVYTRISQYLSWIGNVVTRYS